SLSTLTSNQTATTEISTLSLHDALPICFQQVGIEGAARPSGRTPIDATARGIFRVGECSRVALQVGGGFQVGVALGRVAGDIPRSEEHTSELQSREKLVCRLLLEKKK